MNYSAQLISAVKTAGGFKTFAELAAAIGVHEATLSNWRHNKGSAMPEERVLQLCELAKIADPGPWLAGVHADGVKDKRARQQWESLLDRLRPSVAMGAMLGAVLLGTCALPLPVQAATIQAEQMHGLGIMRNRNRYRLARFFGLFRANARHLLARTMRSHGQTPLLA